ncbi:MAG: molybdenum cofactor biosynthesis protein MoaE [Pelobium sp.]
MEYILTEKIDIAKLIADFEDDSAGAVVIFNGTVRKRSLGKEVSHLFYEAAEEMANKMMEEIIQEAKEKWDLSSVIAFHSIGEVAIGESAVFVLTSSPHRKEAYESNRYIIEKIKHELPLWKCEHFVDGEKKWGGNCSCQEITGDANVHIYDK